MVEHYRLAVVMVTQQRLLCKATLQQQKRQQQQCVRQCQQHQTTTRMLVQQGTTSSSSNNNTSITSITLCLQLQLQQLPPLQPQHLSRRQLLLQLPLLPATGGAAQVAAEVVVAGPTDVAV